MTKMKTNSVTVIVPAYNEAKHINKNVPRICDFLQQNFNDFEVLVVDDGSTDGTYSLVRNLIEKYHCVKVIKNESNRGKGYSVKQAVRNASHDYIVFTDADLSTPVEEIPKGISLFEDDADIVIGSRAHTHSNIQKRQNLVRMYMGKIFNMFVRIFLFRGIKDTQCGFKCFKRNVARKLFQMQRLDGFCFDAEILYIAKKKGFKIKELPVTWINRKNSRVSMMRDSMGMFLDILRIKRNDRKSYYDE